MFIFTLIEPNDKKKKEETEQDPTLWENLRSFQSIFSFNWIWFQNVFPLSLLKKSMFWAVIKFVHWNSWKQKIHYRFFKSNDEIIELKQLAKVMNSRRQPFCYGNVSFLLWSFIFSNTNDWNMWIDHRKK